MTFCNEEDNSISTICVQLKKEFGSISMLLHDSKNKIISILLLSAAIFNGVALFKKNIYLKTSFKNIIFLKTRLKNNKIKETPLNKSNIYKNFI